LDKELFGKKSPKQKFSDRMLDQLSSEFDSIPEYVYEVLSKNHQQ
jgi:hypothetical protein